MDQALAARCGATYDDTEGLINFPLTVKEIEAVVFFKESGPGDWRISMRSKGDVNVNAIAREFGGGGHTNASGCGATRAWRCDHSRCRCFEAEARSDAGRASATKP